MQALQQQLTVHQFPCLSDNYGYLIHDEKTELTACIDTPDVKAINDALRLQNWTLDYILNTHHHHDHAGGNLALKRQHGCSVVGALDDANRIPGIDVLLSDGDEFEFGGHKAKVYSTPGHTLGHIVYHFEEDGCAFVGDTLFSLGCGRLFEGSADQMWHSLSKIMCWPDETLIYCAHEYTEANAAFALTVDPNNSALLDRVTEIKTLRRTQSPTVPTTLINEKRTNPFLRPNSLDLQQHIGMSGRSDVEVFAEVRQRKDNF